VKEILKKHKILRRILRATDFSRIQIGDSLRHSESYKAHINFIKTLRSQLSASQQIALDKVFDSTNFIELITGPFGTGKTSFIALLTRCLKLLGKKVLLCCSSNAAVDTLAHKLEEADPQMKAICFHSISRERRALDLAGKQHGKALVKDEARPNKEATEERSEDEAKETVDTEEDTDLVEMRKTCARLIPLTVFLARKARGDGPGAISLMARSLIHAGIDKDKEIPQPDGDPHKDFSALFLRGDDSKESFASSFNLALQSLPDFYLFIRWIQSKDYDTMLITNKFLFFSLILLFR
jgi:hypothetical protein